MTKTETSEDTEEFKTWYRGFRAGVLTMVVVALLLFLFVQAVS